MDASKDAPARNTRAHCASDPSDGTTQRAAALAQPSRESGAALGAPASTTPQAVFGGFGFAPSTTGAASMSSQHARDTTMFGAGLPADASDPDQRNKQPAGSMSATLTSGALESRTALPASLATHHASTAVRPPLDQATAALATMPCARATGRRRLGRQQSTRQCPTGAATGSRRRERRRLRAHWW